VTKEKEEMIKLCRNRFEGAKIMERSTVINPPAKRAVLVQKKKSGTGEFVKGMFRRGGQDRTQVLCVSELLE